MAKKTGIEWADATFNFAIGCTEVSPGCTNCYAKTLNNRMKWAEGWGPGKARYRTSEKNWDAVRAWNKQAKNANRRPRVFCSSLADWLDDEIPVTWLADLLLLIDETPNLDWLMLTKRPQNFVPRMQAVLDSGIGDTRLIVPDLWLKGRAPENVWFGVSTEDQQRVDERIPALLKIPATVRWLSVEPLLGPVRLPLTREVDRINWVVVGGESGANARGCNTEWVRSILYQCDLWGVPFFFKQWGTKLPIDQRVPPEKRPENAPPEFWAGDIFTTVGKAKAGRLLDGVEYSQFPEVTR
jgi:protein gp37